MTNRTGTLTKNGLFYQAAMKYKTDQSEHELVKVYEKIRPGIWVHKGLFGLVDAWQEAINARKVPKFGLGMVDEIEDLAIERRGIDHSRVIPALVKLEVWERDK